MSSKLRHAIDRNELLLHYQPQVSLISGEIVGLEALIRWNRPGFGLISPGVFIPIAEENGLIIPIGRWVLREAISQIVVWRQSKLPPIKVAVNLSATHFHNDNLPEFVDELLKENDVLPEQLELELTESAMMSDVTRVRNILERLKKVGVHISLDDFGTGHSSLAYLSHFPFDLLKIDQIFVRDVTTNPINASIVAATIAMVHKLGKSVVAEGVETEGQMLFLRRHDCDLIQGYWLSRPCPPYCDRQHVSARSPVVF
ncbi:MAG: EAL domain-containing protein [Desulfobulbus sp.]|nr:EAL domain-containing protein [Desulfobulbus sp.]